MPKIKMKSKRRLMKAIKITGTGKLKRGCAFKGHLAHNKTHKQKLHLRHSRLIAPSDYKRIKQLIQ